MFEQIINRQINEVRVRHSSGSLGSFCSLNIPNDDHEKAEDNNA